MKTFILPLTLAILALAHHANAESYQLGVKSPNDSLVQMSKLSTTGRGKYTGPNGTLDETKIFSSSGGRKITFLEIKDNGDNCAQAIPINGGPGSSFVVMHFTAPANCRIDYDIALYA